MTLYVVEKSTRELVEATPDERAEYLALHERTKASVKQLLGCDECFERLGITRWIISPLGAVEHKQGRRN